MEQEKNRVWCELMYVRVYVPVCAWVCMHVCIVCACVQVHVCMCARACECMCTCVCVHVCVGGEGLGNDSHFPVCTQIHSLSFLFCTVGYISSQESLTAGLVTLD
jgi:hypothetical protein